MSSARRADRADNAGRTVVPDAPGMQVPRAAGAPVRAPEVTAAVMLLIGVGVAASAAPWLIASARAMVRFYLSGAGSVDYGTALAYMARLAAPFAVAGLAGAVAGHLIQNGLPITLRRITPRWRAVAPHWTRLGNRLWSLESALSVVREFLKVAAIGTIAVLNVAAAVRGMTVATAGDGGAVAVATALRIAVQAAVVLLLLAVADYLFRYYRRRQRLHRSPHQVREERRLREGDPAVRDRLRARMRALLARTADDQVAAADVVIAAAARHAVALRWDRLTMTAPVAVAKAAAGGAARMCVLARSHGIAVVEDTALATGLHTAVALGDALPYRFHAPVAAIMGAGRIATGSHTRPGRAGSGAVGGGFRALSARSAAAGRGSQWPR